MPSPVILYLVITDYIFFYCLYSAMPFFNFICFVSIHLLGISVFGTYGFLPIV